MRRVALLALLAACGDNGDPCGYVEPIEGFKNIWSLHLAVDATHVYFSDYDVDGQGTALVIREPLAGGPIQALGVRPTNQTFGRGVALDDRYLYWAAITDEASSSFFASPIAGGMPLLLAPLPACPPSGIAIDASFAYAGTIACNDLPSTVIAVENLTGTRSVVWTADPTQGDVRALATGGGALFIGTTTELFALRNGALETLAAAPAHHLEVHGDTLYYSTDEGIFSVPVAGGDRVRLYTYPSGATEIGSFAVDGTDLYFAESEHMLFTPRTGVPPRIIVENLGRGVGPIVARDGRAYWSVLFLPETIPNLGSFSGGISRVLRPCE